MKKLNVPYHQQQEETDCMLASLKMAFDFCGIDPACIDSERSFFTSYADGVSLPQIGIFAQQHGLKTAITTLNPHLFSIADQNKSQHEIQQHLETKEFINPEYPRVRDDFINYIQSGGEIRIAPVTKEKIKDALMMDHVVIPILPSKLFHKAGGTFHGNVIFGFDEQYFFVHDPALPPVERGGGTHHYDQDTLVYAITVLGQAHLDVGAFLTVGH